MALFYNMNNNQYGGATVVTQTVEKILEKETEADKKIAQAKEDAKKILADAQLQSEKQYHEIIEKATAKASAIITDAQKKSDEKIADAVELVKKNSQAIIEKNNSNDKNITETVKSILFS